MTTNLIAIGTGKGLFLARSEDDRQTWDVSGPHFPMTGVYAVATDPRRSPARLLAGVDSSHFGPIVATSDDLGSSWQEPEERPIAFPGAGGETRGRGGGDGLGPARGAA